MSLTSVGSPRIYLVIGTNVLHDVCTTSAQTGEQKNDCLDTKDEMMVRDTSPEMWSVFTIRHY